MHSLPMGSTGRVGAVALAGFVVVALLMATGATADWDALLLHIAGDWAVGSRGTMAQTVTSLGDAAALLGVAAAGTLLMLRRGERAWVPLPLLALALAWAGNGALKSIFLRPRPLPELWLDAFPHWGQYAFPSGHTMDSTALYGVLILWVLRTQTGRSRAILAAGLVLFPLLIGSSRVVLGAHWPSDVVGGWLAGILMVSLALWLLRWRGRWQPS